MKPDFKSLVIHGTTCVTIAMIVHQGIRRVQSNSSLNIDRIQGVCIRSFDSHTPEDVLGGEICQLELVFKDVGQIGEEGFCFCLKIVVK